MAVSLLFKTFITRWHSLRCSKHLTQDGSPSATQNIHHKMAESLLFKTLTKWQSSCYSKHSQDGGISATLNIPASCFLMHAVAVFRLH